MATGDAAALAAIREPGINLAIWQRVLGAELAAEAAALSHLDAMPLRLELEVAALEAALPAAMAAAGWPAAPLLRADMVMLARRFADVMACAAVDLRLEVIAGDACRKYHADFVTARLITSYAGPGSQWLRQAEAEALAARGQPERLQPEQLREGEVALFKGWRWTERPIIHRSPPIAGSGQRRLLLVINPAEPQEWP